MVLKIKWKRKRQWVSGDRKFVVTNVAVIYIYIYIYIYIIYIQPYVFSICQGMEGSVVAVDT